jgi:oligosaccharyl transferase (archaeosortase A-associated)
VSRETSHKLFIGILVFLFFGIALLYRVALPYDKVFTDEGIKFTSNDAYFHMRIVDSLIENFPHATEFDPYLIYPNKAGGLVPSFMDWLLALVILVIGLGSPTAHTIDVIGAYFPAVMAALTVIPVFFIGKALFNRWAGVFAAALTAILPGEFMGRTILGFTDNHVAETFFSTITIMFLVLALKAASEKQLAFSHFTKGNWKNLVKPLIFSLLAGFFLGTYLLTWQGALMFVFIITLYFIIQFIIDHIKQKSTEYLGITGFLVFLIATMMFLPGSPSRDYTASLMIALLLPPVLMGISLLMSRFKIKPIYYPLALIVIGGAFIGILYGAEQAVITAMFNKFKMVFSPGGATATTTLEMQPFLSPQGTFSTQVAWGNFTTSFFLFPKWPVPGVAFISLIILIYLYIRRKCNEKLWLLLFIWTIVILIATLAQRRFAYYLIINIAVLSAYLSWQVIWLAGLRKLTVKPQETADNSRVTTKNKKNKKHPVKRQFPVYAVNALLAFIIIFFLVLFPNILKSKVVAEQALFAPSDAWQSSLSWMRENTPEPMGNADAYNLLYARQTYKDPFVYPESAYGVTAWWDYGYWITRIARRIPNTNPSQDPIPIKKVANFFLADNESSARQLMKELDSSYIVTDYEICTSKLWAIITWAERSQDEFFSVYYMQSDNQYKPIQALKPSFYQTMLARLYCFNGEAVNQVKSIVLTYEEKTDRTGYLYRLITNAKEFTNYQEAQDYLASQTSGKHEIVGTSPFNSPIPLEALEDFTLVHNSTDTKPITNNGTIPEIKIFEYSAD